MPGVPSGRGCQACRKQKKKCDQATPLCSRCARLGLACIGAGQQKFKFMEENPSRDRSDHRQLATRSANIRNASLAEIHNVPPAGQLFTLASSFAAIIKASGDIRYDLYWSFGSYLAEIPRRLGTNQALDDASMALIEAHSVFCSDRRITQESLHKYVRGLRTLRLYLDDPTKVAAPETLCAANLLVLCETLLGITHNDKNRNRHAEGMAHMLETRAHGDIQDPFEAQLLGAIRGTLAFEGLMNNKIQLSPERCRNLANISLFQDKYEGKLMRALCMVPCYIQLRTGSNPHAVDDTAILEEIRGGYQMIVATITQLKGRITELRLEPGALRPSAIENAYLLRMYGMSLWVAVILCCVLNAAEVQDQQMELQLEDYVAEIFAIVEHLKGYHPLGSMIGHGLLSMAWIGAADQDTREKAEKAMLAFPRSTNAAGLDLACVKWMSRRLRLMDPDPQEFQDHVP